MKVDNFNVIRQDNGLFVVEPKVKLDFEEFKDALAVMKSHGGCYTKGARFLFKDDPTSWLNEQTEIKAKQTEEVKALIKATTPEFKESTGVEFEVHKPAALEECITHLDEEAKKLGVDKKLALYKAILEKCKDDEELCKELPTLLSDHARMLQILSERCKTDEELRANILHKDYQNMVVEGGKAAYQKLEDKNHTALTADDIAEYVIAEYKKVEVKPIEKKKALTKKTATTKKTTRKKAVAKK